MPPSVRSGYSRNPMPSPSIISSASSIQSFIEHHGPDVVLSRKDVQASLTAFELLLNSAKEYRKCMMALAKATSDFAAALEECARQKGANGPSAAADNKKQPAFGMNGMEDSSGSDDTGDRDSQVDSASSGEKLMAASALHYLMGNRMLSLASGSQVG